MGWGDEVIATAHALTVPGPVAILDRSLHHRWHPAWENNPHIAKPGQSYRSKLVNAPGARPYIARFDSARRRWVYRPGVVQSLPKPRLYLTDAEKDFGRSLGAPFLVIEPNVNPLNSPNKDWGLDRWQAVVGSAANVRWVQMVYAGAKRLRGVEHIETPSMRVACGVLLASSGYVGVEGGLHHSAAALGKPAVVVFGGFVHPSITGYAEHINISADDWCGNMRPCEHCRDAMRAITVDQVRDGVMRLWG